MAGGIGRLSDTGGKGRKHKGRQRPRVRAGIARMGQRKGSGR